MLNRFSLKIKLLFLCVMMAIVNVVIGTTGKMTLTNVTEPYTWLSQQTYPKMLLANELYSEIRNYRLYLRTLGGAEKANSEKVIKKIGDIEKKYDEFKDNLYKLQLLGDQKEIAQQLDQKWDKFKVYGHQVVQAYNENKTQELQKLYESEHVLADDYRTSTDALLKSLTAAKDARLNLAETVAAKGNMTVIFMVVAGSLFSLIAGFFFSNSISQAFQKVVEGLTHGAEEVNLASEQIAEASTELSSASTEQAASLQETVAAVDQISSMVQKNSENANDSIGVASKSREMASKGKDVVSSMIQSMEDINTSTNEIMAQTEASNKEISEVINVINEIGNKTKVINDIVFQTKLLSFNASVEAARAGEHGKGFAVVAEEVGNLAQMSGNAAKEISSLLDGSIQKVEVIVNNSKTRVEQLVSVSRQKVDGGMDTARQCGEVLDEIVINVSELSNRVGEIAVASKEQSEGVQEISKAMAQLDQVTQQNATASESVSSLGEKLKAESSNVQSMVRLLISTVMGAGKNIEGRSSNQHAGSMTARETRKVIPLKPKENGVAPAATAKSRRPMAVGEFPGSDDPGFSV